MATDSSIASDGIRNVIVGARSTTSIVDHIVVNGALLNPPCRSFRILRIAYDVGVGNIGGLYMGPSATGQLVFFMSAGNGQTLDWEFRGGLYTSLPPPNGNTITLTTTIGGGSVVDGVCFTMKLKKVY